MRTVPQKVGNRRLLKLAAFLRTLPREKFDYSIWVLAERKAGRLCGTVACAAGWCPRVFPRQWRWRDDLGLGITLPCLREDSSGRVIDDLAAFFGITPAQADYLFLPHCWGNNLGGDASPKQVARHIEQFVDAYTPSPVGRPAGGFKETSMSKQVVGTCGNCGGVVTLPLHYMGPLPPKPTCESCGSTAQTWQDRVLPMNPRPTPIAPVNDPNVRHPLTPTPPRPPRLVRSGEPLGDPL